MARPSNVGIIAMDIFFPNQYISQTELEQHDNVSSGKYTIGLGQNEMAFCTPAQDIYSLCLTAVKQFMIKYSIGYEQIGRLEVGTETIIDHSKSIKTVLMQLFESSGNSDIEGLDTMTACYGGTNALFSSLNWIESSSWDGRYAMVVCGDIAEYARGPARPTSGAGIIVMILGQDAPLVIEPIRATHMEHAYDFYKPNMSSPFPVVDGHLSQTCYLQALDVVYQRFIEKWQRLYGKPFTFIPSDNNTDNNTDNNNITNVSSSDCDYMVFHAPYNKLVQKSYARLYFLSSFLQHSGDKLTLNGQELYNNIQSLYNSDDENTTTNSKTVIPETHSVLWNQRDNDAYQRSLSDRILEKLLVDTSKTTYKQRVGPSTLLPQRLGNLYTASLYAGLLSLICSYNDNTITNLLDKRIVMFSYGSGLAASMFTIKVQNTPYSQKQLLNIISSVNIIERLDKRIKQAPEYMNNMLDMRSEQHHYDNKDLYIDYTQYSDVLVSGEYYLTHKDTKGKRYYAIKE